MTTKKSVVTLPAVRENNLAKLNIFPNQLVKIRQTRQYASEEIPHISSDDVRRMVEVARGHKRNGERDALIISILFDGALRCKEMLGIRPGDIIQDDDGWFIQNVSGKSYKGQKRIRRAAISASLANKMFSYCYTNNLDKNERIFGMNRSRIHQIISAVLKESGIQKPEHVGSVHVLRHSGALERLKQTGNPKALQDQLGHTNAEMTLRYMKTLSKEESLKIQQGVDLKW